MADFLLGGGFQRDVMRRSVELERPAPEVPIEWRPSMMLAMMQKWSGELGDARRRFEELHRRCAEAGEETSLPFLLSQMSETDTLAGNFTDALAEADEAHAIALQTGQEPIRAVVLYARALAAAHLGRIHDARAWAREGLELSRKVGSVLAMMLNQSALGFVELSVDDPAAAHERLRPLLAWRDVVGIREPGVVRFVPDEVEALVALGQLERADDVLRPYEADAERLERPWARLAAARSRALLVSASGDAGEAAAALEAALKEQRPQARPFEKARAQLVLGTILRRTRRRKAARAVLEEAAEGFERLGARLWSVKASRMLGGANDARDGAAVSKLTPAEQRVAALVASGATNRAAADRLFVSVRAVEVHLTSIYRKLGVSSRTQLAATMGRGPGSASGDGTLPVSGRRSSDRVRPGPGGVRP
jgi:DNA-binding NarL/FixJ family response regulator